MRFFQKNSKNSKKNEKFFPKFFSKISFKKKIFFFESHESLIEFGIQGGSNSQWKCLMKHSLKRSQVCRHSISFPENNLQLEKIVRQEATKGISRSLVIYSRTMQILTFCRASFRSLAQYSLRLLYRLRYSMDWYRYIRIQDNVATKKFDKQADPLSQPIIKFMLFIKRPTCLNTQGHFSARWLDEWITWKTVNN